MGTWLRRRRSRPRLRIAQSLGAFTLPKESDISPLFVFFEMANLGQDDVEICRLYVTPKGYRRAVFEGPREGDRGLPCTLGPGEAIRFWVRAKTLAKGLKEAGCGGRPRVKLVAEDGVGNGHEKDFGFRVDEYLWLKDE